MQPSEAVTWLPDGSPFSPRFNDVYRSRAGALRQAQAVFLGGCGLPELWQQRDQFTLLETGFGLGVNFLTTWAAWQADPQRCNVLHYVSIEAYPVAAADLAQSAILLGTETAAAAQQLARSWQQLTPGVNHFSFADDRVQLTLAVGEVAAMLKELLHQPGPDRKADAVYLDGFSPALNPEMWSEATLQALVLHCQRGTRLATYSVAKVVRERLTSLGFAVTKHPGLPPKRERLEAVFSGGGPARC